MPLNKETRTGTLIIEDKMLILFSLSDMRTSNKILLLNDSFSNRNKHNNNNKVAIILIKESKWLLVWVSIIVIVE